MSGDSLMRDPIAVESESGMDAAGGVSAAAGHPELSSLTNG